MWSLSEPRLVLSSSTLNVIPSNCRKWPLNNKGLWVEGDGCRLSCLEKPSGEKWKLQRIRHSTPSRRQSVSWRWRSRVGTPHLPGYWGDFQNKCPGHKHHDVILHQSRGTRPEWIDFWVIKNMKKIDQCYLCCPALPAASHTLKPAAAALTINWSVSAHCVKSTHQVES